jgi:hypothetical protein
MITQRHTVGEFPAPNADRLRGRVDIRFNNDLAAVVVGPIDDLAAGVGIGSIPLEG